VINKSEPKVIKEGWVKLITNKSMEKKS